MERSELHKACLESLMSIVYFLNDPRAPNSRPAAPYLFAYCVFIKNCIGLGTFLVTIMAEMYNEYYLPQMTKNCVCCLEA
jgi:hypothetical protein